MGGETRSFVVESVEDDVLDSSRVLSSNVLRAG